MTAKKSSLKHQVDFAPDEQVFRLMFEEHSAVMLLIEPQTGMILNANQAAADFYGYPKSKLCSISMDEINTLAPEQAQAERQRALNKEQNYFVFPHRLAGGEERIVEVHSSPITFQKNRVLFSIIHDITRRKQGEDNLQKLERDYHMLAQNSPDLIARFDTNLRHTYVNPAAARAGKLSSNEYVGLTIAESGVPEPVAAQWEQRILQVLNTREMMDIVDTFPTPAGIRYFHTQLIPELNPAGSVGSVLSMARDITERRKTEDALRASEDKFRYIFDHSVIGKSITLLSGEVNINQAFCNMLGYSQEEFQNRKWQEITHPEDVELTQNEINALVLGEKESTRFIKRYIHKNGSIIWADISSSLRRDQDGKPLYLITTVNDITERKLAEQKLRELSRVVEQSHASIIIADLQGNIQYVNPKFTQITGYGVEEVLGKNPRILQSGHTTREEYEKMWGTISSGGVWQGEFLNKKKNGETYWELATIAPIFNEDGNIANYLALKEDITQRKIREDQLSLHSKMLENIAEGIYLIRASDSTFVYANPQFEKMFGYASGELIGKNISIIKAPIDISSEETAKGILESLKKNGEWGGEVYNIKKDGTSFWCYANVSKFEHADYGTIWVGANQDISERKRAENEIEKISRHYQALIEKAPDGIVLLDANGNFKFASPSAKKIFGYDISEEVTGNPAEFTHPEDLHLVLSELNKIFADPYYVPMLDYRYRDRSGNWKWVESTFSNMLAEPSVGSIVINFRDITERKQAEKILQESERFAHAIVDALSAHIVILDEFGTILAVNRAWRDFSQSNSEADAALKVYEGVNYLSVCENASGPKSEEAVVMLAGIRAVMSGEQKEFLLEYPCHSPTEKRWFNARVTRFSDEGDLRIVVAHENITTRKLIEESLRSSEERYRAVTQTASAAIISVDSVGKIVSWNHSAELMFGYTEIEAVSQPLTLILPARYQADHAFSTARLQSGGEKRVIGKTVELEGFRKDGSEFPLEISLSEWQIENNKFYTAIIRDITERKHVEDALFKSENKYHLLFDQMLGGMAIHQIICDPQGKPIDYRFLAINAAFENMTGIHSAQAIGKTIMELLPMTEPIWIERYGQVALTREPAHFENYSTALGKHFEVQAFSPEPGQFAVIFNDITERKQTEELLSQQSKQLSLLNEASQRLNRTLDLSEIYQTVCDFMSIIAPSDGLIISAFDSETQLITCRAYWMDNEWLDVSHFPSIPLEAEGKGTQSIAIRTGQSMLVNDFQEMVKTAQSSYIVNSQTNEVSKETLPLDEEVTRSALIVPLKVGGRVTGVIQVTSYYLNTYTETQLKLLEALALHIASAEQNAMLYAQVQTELAERKQAEEGVHQHINELELLYESGLAFSQLLNPKQIAQKIIDLLGEKLNWHHTAIRLIRPQDKSLDLVAFDQQGLGNQVDDRRTVKEHLDKLITRLGEGLSGWALQQSKIVRSGDVSSDPRYVASFPGIHSGLYVPLKSGENMVGVISIESEEPNAFSQADEHLIATLANQAANAFENARLYEETVRYTEKLEQRVQERTAEIESTRQRLELAVKTAGIGIWELDVKQNKDYWDDGLFTLYGLSKENTSPSPETWQKIIHPGELAEQLKLMDEALYHDQPYNAEFRVIWSDGAIHHIRSTGVVIRDTEGVPERMIGANQDVTLYKQAEETLRLANTEMERGLRMKNEFLANMSHELRTPLNAILGISESLEEQISGYLNEKQLKYIRVISESGRHLLELINDILDLSKIEAGKLELDIQSVSVEKLCTSSLRMFKELAQKKSLNVSFIIDENVKVIVGDERRLKQSLVNLLGNAVKFTPSGKNIGLEVKGHAEKNVVIFTVWDEGIGIASEDIPRLFKPFVQLNAGLAREFPGTGLGLALVSQMVHLHGGSISLTSKLKQGSRFTITLPWMPKEQGLQELIKSQVFNDNSKVDMKHTGTILVVDDTEVVTQFISEYLQHKGYKTLMAYDGAEAVLLARKEHPQMILMDVMMPVMDGLKATRVIRADSALRDIPIIGLTALAMPDDRAQCLAAGMNDYLSKPIQIQELVQIIESHLIRKS